MMFDFLMEWVTAIILFLGLSGIAFLMILESIILPLPSEIVLAFSGYLVYNGSLAFWPVVIAATIGSIIGSFLSYEISRYGGRRFLRKYSKYLWINVRHLRWTEGLFERYGEKTIFFCRLFPVVRHFINIPAGTSKMNRGKFVMFTFAGSAVWNTAIIYAGFLLGKQWARIGQYLQPFNFILVIIIASLIVWFIFRQIEKHTIIGKIRPRIVRRSKAFLKRARTRKF